MADADFPHVTPAEWLSDLRRGDCAHVVGLEGRFEDEVVLRRLCEMGFEEGAAVELTHVGPLGGDPLAVRVGQMTVALRRAEAMRIRVRR